MFANHSKHGEGRGCHARRADSLIGPYVEVDTSVAGSGMVREALPLEAVFEAAHYFEPPYS